MGSETMFFCSLPGDAVGAALIASINSSLTCHLRGGHSFTAQDFIWLIQPLLQAKSLVWREHNFNSKTITFLIGKSFAEKKVIWWIVGIAQWKSYLAYAEPKDYRAS